LVLEYVASFNEFITMIGVVVHLAVVNDHARAVVIEHRLRSVRDIDDAQPAMSESDIPVHKNTLVIRPAMMQNIAHLHEFRFIYLPVGSWGKDYAVDTAHTELKKSESQAFCRDLLVFRLDLAEFWPFIELATQWCT